VAHYFEANQPVSPEDTEEMQVELAGRPVRVLTAPGVFSARRLDLGTAVLLRTELRPARKPGPDSAPSLDHRSTADAAAAAAAPSATGQLPTPANGPGATAAATDDARQALRPALTPPAHLMAGLDQLAPQAQLLDLGCGWGPIALVMARLAPQTTVWAVDVNPRALDLTSRNAARLGLANIRTATPQEVPAQIRFDRIWSNPPIRIGKAELRRLLTDWLGRLAADGWADLVVQKNLGADSLARWLAAEAHHPTERLASAKGFRILRCRPGGTEPSS
jgi:16S rRNA G1207 methylase RsmC